MSGETFVKFNNTALDFLKNKHDFENHTFKLYLTNTAPNSVTMQNKADLAGIASGNGYDQASLTVTVQSVTSEGADAVVSATADHVITATGVVPDFRYLVMYNDTDAADALVGYWDYGSTVSLVKAGEKLNVSFTSTELLRLTLTSAA